MSKSERITAPRGMPDALPSDMALLRHLEMTARRVFALCAYEEIRPPLFEDTRLFVRGIGEATDIVEKEMYTFAEGDAGDSITLRPEATASVVRAVIEHEFLKQKGFWKLYYIGPMFRKERPQAGRLRQFDQIGCEAIGSCEPLVDAESILLAARFFREIGLAGVTVKVNSIGCPTCRGAYREALRAALAPRMGELCPDCRNRFDRNVFRILDCKVPACKAVALAAPPMREHLDSDCKAHFETVLALLSQSGQTVAVDDHLVRGFDYYTRTVFELSHSALGARDAVCGGGRYDNLVAELGGPAAGCVGFAVGVVPTILALQKGPGAARPAAPVADLYLAAFSDDVRAEVFRLAERLRGEGVSVEMDYERRSLKAQMRSANKLGARYAIVIGPDEIAGGEFKLKEMATGVEQRLKAEAIAPALRAPTA